MREIKFRAWDKELEEMTYIEGESDLILTATCKSKSYHYYIVPASNELMQYTGLKDKNGVEIYEGDILKFKFDSEEFISSVWYCVNHFKYETDDYDLCEIDEEADWVEVIGNIQENKELL